MSSWGCASELREEQVQWVRKKGTGGTNQVLSAVALMEEAILDQRQVELMENRDANSITEVAVLEINESGEIRELCRALCGIPETANGKNRN